MRLAARPDAVVFDAFGTLFDVGGVDAACAAAFPGQGAGLGRLWREKQLQHSWLGSLMGRYRDFEQVTADALDAACRQLGLELDPATRARLTGGYRALPPFPDVPPALAALDRSGCRLAILSNGTPAQLQALVGAAGLPVHLDLLSADAARVFKPDPRVYALAEGHLGLGRARVLFVSANPWDIAGALAYGFACAWLNRRRMAWDAPGPQPGWVGPDLGALAAEIAGAG